VCIFGTNIILH
jgi:hypothetical protein